MATVRQTSFATGEVSPYLWGRTDLAKYAHGLRRLRNFFVSRQGAAVSRPGTVMVAKAKLQDGSAVRLVPFVYSDTQSYVLEFGEGYIRFYSQGSQVIGFSSPYELASPYTASELAQLQWVQSGDVLTLTHPNHAPRELRRYGHTNWTLTALSFDVTPWWAQSTAKLVDPLPTEDVPASMPAREWAWAVTAVFQRGDGSTYETAPFQVTLVKKSPPPDDSVPAKVAVYPSKPVTLWFNTGGLTQDRMLAIRIYRGRGGIFGWVGDVEPDSSGSTYFTDAGQEPNYSIAPPQGRNPFAIYDGAGTLLRTEKPIGVSYFQQRLAFGGTAERPATLLFSSTEDYANFDQHLVRLDSDALEYELASRRREEIRWLLGLGRLLVGTRASIWSMGGSGGDALAPSVIPDARVELEIGSTFLPPLTVEGAVLFARAKKTGVHGLIYDQNRQGFAGIDLSVIAQHLVGVPGIELADWCYAEDPWGLVWAVRADGKLLSLTYSPADEMWAWAWHDTQGAFKNVCSVPEGSEDAVYLVVTRNGGQTFIERMTSRLPYAASGAFDICVDSALQYVGTATQTIAGLDHLEGMAVYAVSASNPPYGPLTVTGGSVTLPELPSTGGLSQLIMYVGLAFTPELETLDVPTQEKARQKTVTYASFEVDQSKGLWAGQDFEHLKEWRQRLVATGYGAISGATELVRMAVEGTWNPGGRACLRQTLPLPLTVLGLSREVDSGS